VAKIDGTLTSARQVRCALCNTKAIVYLPYSRRALCKKHFLHSVESRVKRTIRRYQMLDNARHIAVAVSGGKDSLTTLYILNQIAAPAKIKLTAIIVDEGIKGYRDKMIEETRRICEKIGVQLNICSFKEEIGFTMDEIAHADKEQREVSCTYCGVFRRWILNKAAREIGADRIAVGHNLDDVIQSYLMNVLRNEPSRLARFGPVGGIIDDEKFVKRIRPLFTIPEKEIALYAILRGLKSDFGGCPYVEEAFRPVVRNFLNDLESKYPSTKLKLFSSFIEMQKILEEKYKEAYSDINEDAAMIKECSSCNELSSSSLCKRCELIKDLKALMRR